MESKTAMEKPQPEVEYDLTSMIAPYLDLHMMLPLVEFLEESKIYNAADLMHVKFQLLEPTNMVDYAMEVQQELDGTTDEHLVAKRDEVVENMEQLKTECAPILDLLADNETTQELYDSNMFTYEHLEENYGLTPEMLEAFYHFAKQGCYEVGNYSDTIYYLSFYRLLDPSSNRSFAALWGKLASEILQKNWNEALEDIKLLQQIIDEKEENSLRQPNHLEQLQLRSWLLHWSLWVFFNHENGRNEISDFFFQQKYLNAIQTNCPWLLRYLTTAVITNKRRRGMVGKLVRVIQQEHYTYNDPLTEFLEALYVNFDFDLAQEKLLECEKVLMTDYFLVNCHQDFLENARLFIFETYCRVHTKVDLTMLSERLRLNSQESERWIVDLIRNAKLDAKIDSEKNQVVMGKQHPEVYQQVIEKTKDLSFRTFQIASNVLSLNEQAVVVNAPAQGQTNTAKHR